MDITTKLWTRIYVVCKLSQIYQRNQGLMNNQEQIQGQTQGQMNNQAQGQTQGQLYSQGQMNNQGDGYYQGYYQNQVNAQGQMNNNGFQGGYHAQDVQKQVNAGKFQNRAQGTRQKE